MTLAIAFELLLNLAQSILGTLFIIKFNRSTLRACVFAIPVTLLVFGINSVFTFITIYSGLQSLIITAVYVAFSFSVPKAKLITKLLAPIIFETGILVLGSLSAFLSSFLLSVPIEILGTPGTVTRYLFSSAVQLETWIVLLLFLRVFTVNRRFRMADFFLYLVTPVGTLLTLYTFTTISLEYETGKFAFWIAISLIILLLVNIFSLLLFRQTANNAEEKLELELLRNQSKLELEKYNEMGRLYEQLRTMRHDYKEQLVVLKDLAQNGAMNQVHDYITAAEERVGASSYIVYTGNRLVDCILNAKITANSNVHFRIAGTLSDEIAIPDLDFASLLGNMLENAVEAVTPSDVLQKEINLLFSVKNGQQSITCRNPINESVMKNNPELHTTKKDLSRHGLGIKSMRRLVENAGGMIEFYEDNSCFNAHAILPLQPCKQADESSPQLAAS